MNNKDTVTIDRAALTDLITAVTILSDMVNNTGKPLTVEILDQEIEKLKYVNKLILTAMASFENNNQ